MLLDGTRRNWRSTDKYPLREKSFQVSKRRGKSKCQWLCGIISEVFSLIGEL
jgi:hypothetical protein